jgi:hypothetical protein
MDTFGEIVSQIFGIALAAFLIFHLYFLFLYETVDPCEIAINRVVDEVGGISILAVAFADQEVEKAADDAQKEIGIYACYKVAIMGSEALPRILAKKAREERRNNEAR